VSSETESFDVTRSMLGSGTAVVAVSGEIDVRTAPRFEELLGDGVDDVPSHGLVVDLSGVTFLDSTALNVLVRCLERQKLRRERLCLVSSDRRVLSLLEVTRLDRIFEVVPDRDKAVERVSRSW
jgi:anti-sigma B factor antagonist